jgi:5-(carboxyamino)imidazole ribonucleotide synthase
MSQPDVAEAPGPTPSRSRSGPVVGMVGAGQLARMTHAAAIALGIELRVLAPGATDPAVLAGARRVPGNPASLTDLRALAAGADVVTFDHESVPPEHLIGLEHEGVRLAPAAAAKLFAQDKLHARRELVALDFPAPPFAHVRTPEEIREFSSDHPGPLIAKVSRGGYDGRGVFAVEDAREASDLLGGRPDGLLLEPRLTIERELAVVVARSASGERVAYPVVETVQQDAMCREMLAPAPIAPAQAARAQDLALAIGDAIGAVGIVAVELFDVEGELLVNELALRPHNSGHYTLGGCTTSQFEQHLRAVLGWPLGAPDLVAPAVATVNVVGPADGSDPAARLPRALAVQGAQVQLYGKEPRPGRKLGHVTVCGDDLDAVRRDARLAAALLEGGES